MIVFKCERLKTLEEVILRVNAMGMGAGNFGNGSVVDLTIGDHGFVFKDRKKRRIARLANGMQTNTIVVELQSLDEDIPGIIKINDAEEYLEVASAITNWFCVEDGNVWLP